MSMPSSASPLTQISIPTPHDPHTTFVQQTRSPVQVGLGGNGSVFHGAPEGSSFGKPPTTSMNCAPPGIGIGGKFIFKSNVIQNPADMPPGAPFLLMKQPQGHVTSNQFPPDHGRVVLVAGRHMPCASPPNSQAMSTQQQQQPQQQLPNCIPGHSPPNLSSHGHNATSSSNGNGTVSSSVQNCSNRKNGNGKAGAMTSREKKDLFTQRKQREFIPDNKKDDNYWDRRRRNNEAAKRSREKRRFNDMILEQRVIELTKENHILKAQLDAIKDKYNICGGDLISLDQIMSTMPTPDQVLNVNTAGHLTIASGLTTQHFRNFQMAREARGDSVITGSSPAKKLKLSPKSEDRSNGGAEDEDYQHSLSEMPQPDSQIQDPSPEKEYFKPSLSPSPMPSGGVVRLIGASPLPPPMDKSPPTGLINYSLRDIYYNNTNGNPVPASSEATCAVLPMRGHLAHSQPGHDGQHHLERSESEFGPSFQYPSSSGIVPVKYEEPDDGHQQPHHHHHCPSPPYRPHPAHLPVKVVPGHSNVSHYYYDEQRRKRFEEPAESPEDDHEVEREQFMLLHRRQPEGAHLSQLELILNLSAKRDTEVDQRSEVDVPCTDRDSPVLMVAKSHANLLPLKLRHKNNHLGSVKHDLGGPELRRVQLMHGDDADDEDVDHIHPHHHHDHHPHHMEQRFDGHSAHLHHHLHLRHSPIEEHKGYPEDSRLVKTEDYDDDEEELQHRQRIIEGGNARRVHCHIEVEKLSSPNRSTQDEEEDKRYRSLGRAASPKPNNSILKTQLARLENEMATIKNMMYMNTNQATAAAQ